MLTFDLCIDLTSLKHSNVVCKHVLDIALNIKLPKTKI